MFKARGLEAALSLPGSAEEVQFLPGVIEKLGIENQASTRDVNREPRAIETEKKNTNSNPKKESLKLSLSNFTRGHIIADGSCATVVEARTIRDTTARKNIPEKELVLKCVPKFAVTPKVRQYLHREKEVHLRVGSHPNIVTLYASFEDVNGIYLALERLYGPTLHRVIRKNGRLQEKFALQITDQLLEGICYMHSRGFSHRDLSSKNIMFREWPCHRNGPIHVMLIDLGHACYRSPDADVVDRFSSEKIGTLLFTAPEVHRDTMYQPESCDMWSIGVLMYMMLTGKYPYFGGSNEEILRIIQENMVKLEGDPWDRITEGTKDIIQRLLCAQPYMRPDAEKLRREVQWVLRGKPLQELGKTDNPMQKPHSERVSSEFITHRGKKEGKRRNMEELRT